MSKEIDELRRKFKAQFGDDSDMVFQGVVTEVDETEFTCTVKRDDAVDYFDVRLRGLVNSGLQGFAFIPKIQSTVLVCRIGRSNELFVCQFTEIDKIRFTDNDFELRLNKERVKIIKGDNIEIYLDAEKLEIINSQVKITQKEDTVTLISGESTVEVATEGITLKKGSSSLKKTLDDTLQAIQALTVTTPHGVSSTPINSGTFASIQANLPLYLVE